MKTLLLMLVLSMGIVFGAADADEHHRGWYVGAGVGSVFSDYNISDFDDGSIVSGNVDDDGAGWKIFGGYKVNQYLAFEGGYVDLNALDLDDTNTFEGISDGTGTVFNSFPLAPVSVDINDPDGIFVAVVGSYPLADRVAITGKIGALSWEADETTNDLSPRTIGTDGTNAFFGLGLEYQFPSGLGLRIEKELYQDVADLDREFTTVGVVYRFK